MPEGRVEAFFKEAGFSTVPIADDELHIESSDDFYRQYGRIMVIEKLAEPVRKEEMDKVIARIKEKYQILAQDPARPDGNVAGKRLG